MREAEGKGEDVQPDRFPAYWIKPFVRSRSQVPLLSPAGVNRR